MKYAKTLAVAAILGLLAYRLLFPAGRYQSVDGTLIDTVTGKTRARASFAK